MKRLSTIVVLFVVLLAALGVSTHECVAAGGPYHRLDSLIMLHERSVADKKSRIDSVRAGLAQAATPEQEYAVNESLLAEYAEFQNDSALRYAARNVRLAIDLNDASRYIDSRLSMMQLLAKSYLLDETIQMAATIDTTRFTAGQRLRFYKILSDIYLFKMEFHQGSSYQAQYQAQLTAYRERVAQLSEPGSEMNVRYRAGYLHDTGRTDQAISLLESLLTHYHSGERTFSIITSTLAFYYGSKGNISLQKQLLAQSAASDLEGCIMDNTALRQLAALLFDEGDVDRAYRYINISVADATFYGTRLRNVQASQLVPSIISAYHAKQEKHHRRQRAMIVALSVVALLLVAGVLALAILYKRYRRISNSRQRINQQLNATVAQLEQSNTALRERDKIKEQYLGRFLALSSSLIDRTERQRKALNRLSMDRKQQELATVLKSQNFYHENTALFYHHFDTAFLSIYPDFIDAVNRLLEPQHRIMPKDGGQLSTELRILALLRLGITDNKEIASILRSSITTIYTYRSKLKSHAIDKEAFETLVKNLQLHG
ncbi:MAG: hypothetical protein IJ632_02095 [Muribaculaceae bacterium]|nr:hypothetical protein [Muribaculaceae bacterium]